ncbi:MAG TPA: hypothetical protein VMW38_24390 [Terriglobia bacterium]|nr:hypothetical protein [Terriglobia bacterium]
MYYENNIQGAGKCSYLDAQTLRHPDLVDRMDEYVRKITQEVNQFDNVILEICDEPSLFTPHADAGPWVSHFVGVIKGAENSLSKKHLIAQEVEGPIGGPIDLSGNPDVSIVVGQYVWEGGSEQIGGMKALDFEYGHNKVIEFNETAYYPVWYKGDQVAASRVEAWEFMVGGGASFNQLNGRFTVQDPAGRTPDNAQILAALQTLKNFIFTFDFLKMRPDKTFIKSEVPQGAYRRSISQPGEQYALYQHHSKLEERNHYYIVTPGAYHEEIALTLPGGTYKSEWIEPASGSVVQIENFTSQGRERTFTVPPYTVDIALRIKRIR